MKTFFRILCVLATFLAASAPAATLSVKVQNLSFVPSDLTITNGDTVVFTGGNNFHTVTGDSASQPFCGSDLFTTCSVTFNQVGTYHYRCIPHAAVGMRGVIRVVSGVTSPLTVIIHGQGTVAPDLNGQALDVGNTYVMTAMPALGFTFAGWTGGLTSSVARLSFEMQANLVLEANFVDSTAPTVTITAPSANTRLTNNTVTLHGTASDASGVAVVEYRVANAAGPGSFQTAAGTTTWSAVASDLVAGTNLFYVRAQDTPGNRSAEVTLSVLVLTRLTVTTNGAGTVSAGFLGTTFRDPGRSLSLTATAASGYLFTHWTGSIESSANPLSFVPASNMTLQANFELSPFPARNLSYNGLFYVDDQTNGVQQDSSGSFSFVLAKTGKYSGTLRQGAKRYAFSGQFDQEGTATNAVKRPGTNDLSLELSLELNGGSAGRVEGRVINPVAGWVAELEGDPAPIYVGTNASPYRGSYTLILTNEDQADTGHGFGSVIVDPKGKLRFTGTLADSTAVTQSVPVSDTGMWPLYVPLYGGKGSILSWVTFSTNPAPAASLYGELSWIKPSLPGKYYADGFTNEMDIVGSIYQPPGTNPVLQINLGAVTFEGGNLTRSFTNSVTLGPKNQLINLTTNQPLLLKITLPTGLLSGTVKLKDGGLDKKLSFKGAILQRQNLAAGFFLGTNQSGSVDLEPVP